MKLVAVVLVVMVVVVMVVVIVVVVVLGSGNISSGSGIINGDSRSGIYSSGIGGNVSSGSGNGNKKIILSLLIIKLNKLINLFI